jgi:hypothetical protein
MEKKQLFENILKENVELDDAFSRFREAFLDNMKSYIDEETIDNILSSVSGRWALRSYRDYYVVLNVKGKGFGNYDRFNFENRAEKVNKLASYDYEKMMFRHIDDFWDDLKEDFQREFGVELCSLGRYGGWWGFSADDFVDHIVAKDSALRGIYDQRVGTLFVGTEDEDDVEDIAVDVLEDMSIDLSSLVEIEPSFKESLEAMDASITKTSDYWETDEFNDEEYNAQYNV